MPFLKLNFRPGINRDQTSYSGEGGWYECDKIRFFSGYPQKLGGWQKATPYFFFGTSRQVFNWITSYNDNFLAVGTNNHVYIEVGGQFYNITPVIRTVFTSAPLSGVGATGSIGSVKQGAPITGVEATGAIQNIETTTGLTGVGSTGSVGIVTP